MKKIYIDKRIDVSGKKSALNTQNFINLYEYISNVITENVIVSISPWTDSGNGNVYNITDSIGIGIASPSKKLDVVGGYLNTHTDSDGYVWNTHQNNIGITPLFLAQGAAPGFVQEAIAGVNGYYYDLFVNTDSTDMSGVGTFEPLWRKGMTNAISQNAYMELNPNLIKQRQLENGSDAGLDISVLSTELRNIYLSGISTGVLCQESGMTLSYVDSITSTISNIKQQTGWIGLIVDDVITVGKITTADIYSTGFVITVVDTVPIDIPTGNFQVDSTNFYIRNYNQAGSEAYVGGVLPTVGDIGIEMKAISAVSASMAWLKFTIEDASLLANKIHVNVRGIQAYANLAAAIAAGLVQDDIFKIGTALHQVP